MVGIESRAAFARYSADVNDLLAFQGFRLAVEDELRNATVAARFDGRTWDRVEAALSIRRRRRMRGEDC